MSEIDDDQCLFFVYGRVADAAAFQAALVYQPSGGEFDRSVCLGIVRHGWVGGEQFGGTVCGNHGVFEEAADIALNFRVGQFAAADGADGFGNAAGSRLPSAALFGQYGSQIAVSGFQDEVGGEFEYDGANDVTAFAFLLEQAVAVGEAAFGVGKFDEPPFGQIEAFDGVDQVFHFYAVGTDILYRRRAHRAGNQAQVFQAVQSEGDGVADEVVPDFACLRFQQHQAV